VRHLGDVATHVQHPLLRFGARKEDAFENVGVRPSVPRSTPAAVAAAVEVVFADSQYLLGHQLALILCQDFALIVQALLEFLFVGHLFHVALLYLYSHKSSVASR
jgi:hypothetical protein